MTDAFAPRPIDLPTPVPIGADDDLSVLDEAKILAAPDDSAEWPQWRSALRRWRVEARHRLEYDDARYLDPATEWASRAWNVAMVWLWDEALYDWEAGCFDVERLVATYRPFGGLDAVVLWHAYPVIGVDPRNQFDWYRGVPGLAALVSALHERGLHVFVDYNPWDVGTRRAAGSDPEELAALVADTGVDGIFLDTLKEGDPALMDQLRRLDPVPVLEGESRVPLRRVADQQASWAQWFADSEVPGVLRARWFEQRHMMHHTRRWNRDHGAELASAWVNGAGVLIWDVVFGVWVGWSERDLATLRGMRRVHRALGDHLLRGEWEPLTALAEEATRAGVHGSRWSYAGSELWTVVNRGDGTYAGPLLAPTTADASATRCYDVLTGMHLDPSAPVTILPGKLAGVLQTPDLVDPPRWLHELLAEARADVAPGGSWSTDFPSRPSLRLAVPEVAGSGAPAPGAVRIDAGRRTLAYTYRQRETGMYEAAPYVDDWKPLPPRLHGTRDGEREVEFAAVALDAGEVTNAEFAEFVRTSGYTPVVSSRFLAHWVEGRPPPGTGSLAVTYVDLDDARAYATWRGARLPTEDEWQVASELPKWRRSQPRVWSWTESEHRDGRTRWAVLKGGSWFRATGSEWYVDGGPQDARWSLRLLLSGGGMSRSECVGFRCAVDLPDQPARREEP